MDNNIIRISEIFDISSSKPYINDVIDSNWISYTGKYVKLCEDIINLFGLFLLKKLLTFS